MSARAGVEAVLAGPPPWPDLSDEDWLWAHTEGRRSHLPEETHLAWLPVLRRVLRPGGVIIATTFPRSHIELHSTFRADRHRAGRPGFVHEAFSDTASWLTRYDRGEFCFSGRPADPHFGDTCVPEQYVRDVWAEWFQVLDYIRDPARCAQNVVVPRKPIQERTEVNPGDRRGYPRVR